MTLATRSIRRSKRDGRRLRVRELKEFGMEECVATAARDSGASAYGVSKAAERADLDHGPGARAAPDPVNATIPGWVRTDMGGRGAPRSVEEGAASVLFGVTLPEGGPTGKVFRDGAEIPP